MEAFLATAAGLALTGVTWLAYKHSAETKNLLLVLQLIFLIIFVSCGSYNLGVQAGGGIALKLSSSILFSDLQNEIAVAYISWYAVFGALAVSFYFWFLATYLPGISLSKSLND